MTTRSELLKPYVTDKKTLKEIERRRKELATFPPENLTSPHAHRYRYHHFFNLLIKLREHGVPELRNFLDSITTTPDHSVRTARTIAQHLTDRGLATTISHYLFLRSKYGKRIYEYLDEFYDFETDIRYFNDVFSYPLESLPEEVLERLRYTLSVNSFRPTTFLHYFPEEREFLVRFITYRNKRFFEYFSLFRKMIASQLQDYFVLIEENELDDICMSTGFREPPSQHCFEDQIEDYQLDKKKRSKKKSTENNSDSSEPRLHTLRDELLFWLHHNAFLSQCIREKSIVEEQKDSGCQVLIKYSLLSNQEFLDAMRSVSSR